MKKLAIAESSYLTGEVNVLDHIAINVKDIDRSVIWYCSNFGFDIEYIDETWAMLKRGDTKLALTIPSQHPPHIAFQISDESSFPNGKIKEHRDGSKYLYQEDPDGNVIEWIYYPE